MLRLLLDEHLSPDVARGVAAQRPACIVLCLQDLGSEEWLGASDERLLSAACEPELTLVTYDQRTIVPLLRRLAEAGTPHAGVVLVNGRTIAANDVGGLVRALIDLFDRHGPEGLRDRVLYLSRSQQ